MDSTGEFWTKPPCRLSEGPTGPRCGFSLLEVLLVIALGGLLITAIASLLFGIVKLSDELRTQPYFDEHVEGVTRMVRYLVENAEAEPPETISSAPEANGDANGDDPSDGGENGEDADARGRRGSDRIADGASAQLDGEGVEWAQAPGAMLADRPVLAMTIGEASPMLRDDEEGLPGRYRAFLKFDEDLGLILIWQSAEILEEDPDSYRHYLLSPDLKMIVYYFYDEQADEWETFDATEAIDTEEYGLPTLIELQFESSEGRQLKRRILMPPTEQTPPAL